MTHQFAQARQLTSPVAAFLAVLSLNCWLLWPAAAFAQTGTTGTSFGSAGGTGFGGAGRTGTGGSTGSFSGGSTGSTTQSGTTSGASTTGLPSSSNPFRTYYVNPYASGRTTSSGSTLTGSTGSTGTTSSMGSTGTRSTTGTTQATAFGQPQFATSSTGTSAGAGTSGLGAAGNRIGGVSTTSGTTTAGSSALGFATTGDYRAPAYITVLGDTLPQPTLNVAPHVMAEVASVLQRSTALPTRNNISVNLEEGVFVLRGVVQTPREQRLAEALVRLTPGVRAVRNELLLQPSP